jgi:hypothetical protein
MKDIIFVLLTIGFFALTVLYVQACARIVGPDESEAGAPADETPAEVKA